MSLEELLAKCESEFEKEVLREIHRRGLPLPDDAQVTIFEGDNPIASADFFYRPKILVFVDGSPHFLDYVKAADETKRKRLKAKGYRIVPIEAGKVNERLQTLSEVLGVAQVLEWSRKK